MILLNHVVPMDTIVNVEYYAHIFQTNLGKAICRKQPDIVRRGYILHQDNTAVHRVEIVQDALTNLNITTSSPAML